MLSIPELGSLGLLAAASMVLIITPGPDMMYIIARGIAQGRRIALLSALGVCTGLFFQVFAAAFGLSALLGASAAAFVAIKYAGAVYLVFLGVKTLLSKGGQPLAETRRPAGPLSVFGQGVLSNVLNPKVALFFLSFLPQFVDHTRTSPAAQMLLLGAVFAAMGVVWLLAVALLSAGIGRRLRTSPGVVKALNRLSGGILIGLGLHLACLERR